jgi:Zn-dependent protease
MSDTNLVLTPSAATTCRECGTDLPSGTLACPYCAALVYSTHLDQISKAARNLEENNLPHNLAEARDLWLSALPWLPRASRQAEWIRLHVLTLDARINATEPPAKPSKWTKRLGPLAPIAVFLAKAKTALLLLLKLKFLLSFVTFFGVYWALYGLWFGAGFAISILIHEFGHVIAVKRRGLQADLPVFLPGFGAYVRWQGFNISLSDRATIALAGPLAGFFAAVACFALYSLTHRPVFAALAQTGAWLNLLNLIPIWVLDGGQAVLALNRLQRGLLLLTCILFFAITSQGVYLLVAAGMVYRLFTKDQPTEPSSRTMVFFMSLLFALGALLKLLPPQPTRHF